MRTTTRAVILMALLAAAAHAQSGPVVFGVSPDGTVSSDDPANADTTLANAQTGSDPAAAPVPGDPGSTTAPDPNAVPADPNAVPMPADPSTAAVPTAPGSSDQPGFVPADPGYPAGPSYGPAQYPPLPGGLPGNPGAALGMLGIPYAMSPDGRCAVAQAGGYTIQVCMNDGMPGGPGQYPPPMPPMPPPKAESALAPVTVQSGDTLGELCQQAVQMAISMGLVAPPGPSLWGAGGLVDAVARHNSVDDPDLIFPGQVFDMNVDELGAGGAVGMLPPEQGGPIAVAHGAPGSDIPVIPPPPPVGPGVPPPPGLPPMP